VFDALILPDGDAGVAALAKDAHTNEFVTNQFRHCKAILALGASLKLLKNAGVPDAGDAGLMIVKKPLKGTAKAFIAAVSQHRFPERETDPPAV